MSRNTHDRGLDHHGTDSASNIALAADLPGYATGETIDDVLASLISRITYLESQHTVYTFTISAEISY